MLRLAAWWIPAAQSGGEGLTRRQGDGTSPIHPLTPSPGHPLSSKTVLFIHGYADAKVGSIAWAPYWHELGFNILAIDLRAHGDSEGTLCSGGFHERHDVAAIVRELVAQRPAETQTLILFGASMGAAVAAGAAEILTDAAKTAPPLVHGLVLDSPFVNFRMASSAHFRRLGLPGGRLASAAFRLAQRMTAADFTAIDLFQIPPRIRCPILVIIPAADPYLPAEAIASLETIFVTRDPFLGHARIVQFPEAGHLMAAVTDPTRYLEALHDYVASSLPLPDT
jgi:pimeloyl-ACP methyl ester carboxylesterase